MRQLWRVTQVLVALAPLVRLGVVRVLHHRMELDGAQEHLLQLLQLQVLLPRRSRQQAPPIGQAGIRMARCHQGISVMAIQAAKVQLAFHGHHRRRRYVGHVRFHLWPLSPHIPVLHRTCRLWRWMT